MRERGGGGRSERSERERERKGRESVRERGGVGGRE